MISVALLLRQRSNDQPLNIEAQVQVKLVYPKHIVVAMNIKALNASIVMKEA